MALQVDTATLNKILVATNNKTVSAGDTITMIVDQNGTQVEVQAV